MVRRLFAALIAAAVLTPEFANAAAWKPNLKIGSIELHPFYKLTESYDSNIYLVPPDKANGVITGGGVLGSRITDNTFGLNANWSDQKKHSLSAGYEDQALTYSKQPSANNAYHQRANLTYDYKRSDWNAKLWDTYINTTDQAFSELTERSQRWHNQAGAVLGYAPEGGKGFLEFSGDHNNHKYLDSSPSGLGFKLNRYEQTFGGRFGYAVMPKTKAYVGYRRSIIHYNNIPSTKNNKSHLFDFGVEGKLANKLTGKVQSGWTLRRYDDDRATLSGRNRDQSTLEWIVSTQLNWKPLERSSVDLLLSRTLQESTFGDNRYYTANLVSLNASHKLPWRLTAKLGLSAGFDKYPEATTAGGITANRRDDTYTQSVGLDHQCQEWLGFGVSYEHKQRHSIFTDQFNYERHLTMLQARITF